MFKLNFDITKKKKLINPEDLLPKTVENTRGELLAFDASKLIDSLMRETGLEKKQAVDVTRNVLRRISTLGLDFIAAPHLRELICGELTAEGLHNYRNQYTRLGIPIYDVKRLLEGNSGNDQILKNPTATNVWLANQVIEQYVHLDQISQKARELHLKGLITIDLMRNWDQPLSVQWDLRTILLFGLPPVKVPGIARSRPAQNALTAVSQAAKWLSLVQSEFAAGQGYDNFTTFLAPYLKGLPYKADHSNVVDIMQVAQSFVYETNQVFGSFLGPHMDSFISCTPYIPEELSDIDAVGPGGKVVGKYKDYENECRQFFKALVEVYGQGDADGQPIQVPRHEIKINKRGLVEFDTDYQFMLEKEALTMGTAYIINNCSGKNIQELHNQSIRLCLKSDGSVPNVTDFDYKSTFNTFGLLQNITINLARLAYISKKDQTTIIVQLDAILPELEQVLLKKHAMIKREIDAPQSILPFCKGILPASHMKSQPLFDFAKQYLSISISGLAQCVKILTDQDLSQEKGMNLAAEIVEHLQKFMQAASIRNNLHFVMSDKSVENSEHRFAQLDMKFEAEMARAFVLGANKESFVYGPSVCLDLSEMTGELVSYIQKQGKLQSLIGGSTYATIPKSKCPAKLVDLWALVKNITQNTSIQRFHF